MSQSAVPATLWSELTNGRLVTDAEGNVRNSGDVAAELAALTSQCLMMPVSPFSRILVRGQDRKKYLHNFCTNDINKLPEGQACEVFFADVKARILAHGYVLAFAEYHSIHMLPGNETALLDHLNRYIITEDVQLQSVSDATITVAVAGPGAAQAVSEAIGVSGSLDPGTAWHSDTVCVHSVLWNGLPVLFVSTSDRGAVVRKLAETGCVPGGLDVFHHLRICEGFSICGLDVSSENLVPEASRISQAISYNKGCYLGQEPIARLDAMGHLNRRLYRCRVRSTAEMQTEPLATVTSVSAAVETDQPALAVLPVRAVEAGKELTVRLPDGRPAVVTVADIQPAD